MSEEKLSNSLDIEQAQRSNLAKENSKRESYKPISEDIGLTHVTGDTVKNSNMVRENGDHTADGADEKMLGSDDKEALALKGIEVKFISADQNQNGDAKIDIGNVEKTFTGMTKEELMKYANDPFWVRLRWILFILFWAVWIAMLLGAIAIIVYAPKCAAPTPLVWWKTGPLVTVDEKTTADEIQAIKDFKAQGVIVTLDQDETYLVDTPGIKQKLEDIISKYKAQDLHVIMDLTPNFVGANDATLQEAIKSEVSDNNQFLSTFITHDKENNWKMYNSSGSAWKEHNKRFFLTQFGENRYDLQMSSPVAQQKLKNTLEILIDLGVKGFRLNHAKHFIVSSDLSDEDIDSDNKGKYQLTDYHFYQHKHTTNQNGLGDVIRVFSQFVHNKTGGEGFLTIRDDAAERVDNYVVGTSKILGFDLPRVAFLNNVQSTSEKAPKLLHSSFDILGKTINMDTLWMQIPYDNIDGGLDPHAYDLFMSLLPGVKIGSLENLKKALDAETAEKLEKLRESQVFQFGSFDFLLSNNDTAFAYTRVKSGNPGYLVAVNPTNDDVKADFSNSTVGNELTVFLLSGDATQQNAKISAASVELKKNSVGIFTFIPK